MVHLKDYKNKKNVEKCFREPQEGIYNMRKVVEVNEKDSYSVSKESIGIYDNSEVNKKTNQVVNNVIIKGNRLWINSKEDKLVSLEFDKNISIRVNGKEVLNGSLIRVQDEIEIVKNDLLAKRDIKLSLGKKNLECTLKINYEPEIIIDVSATFNNNVLKVVSQLKEGKLPIPYNKDEIIEVLKANGIVFGIIEDKIEQIVKEGIDYPVVVAQGKEPINDIEDKVEVYFESNKRNVEINSMEKINYRNVYSSSNVISGDTIAELVVGQEGIDGTNVFGNTIKRTRKKAVKFKSDLGCTIVENKIISQIDGRPSVKNGIFSVNKVLETTRDVDIKSGNINFIGDVVITGSVKEGMIVQAGNTVAITGNVEAADVIAQGEININGSIINSKIIAQTKDKGLISYLGALENLNDEIKKMVEAAVMIKNKNSSVRNISDGEIIKILLQTKFKGIQRKALVAVSMIKENPTLGNFLREKFIIYKSLNIKYLGEVYDLIKYIEIEMENIKGDISIPVDVNLLYSQDSVVKATGSIFIKGKGQYVSKLVADKNIEFLQNDAVSRGGILIAGNEIKAKVIGSIAGVSTTLKVSKKGVITADKVYQNTLLYFGDKYYNIESPVERIKAYVDKTGDIVVERLLL